MLRPRLTIRSTFARGTLGAVAIVWTAGCGGHVQSSPVVGTTSGTDAATAPLDAPAGTPSSDAGAPGSPAPDATTSTPGPALPVAYDGGGMPLPCWPGDAGASVFGPPPVCTFVASEACQSDSDCGCGCGCQCGVCDCNAPAAAACAPGAPCCTRDSDCGPACYGLACVGMQCVPAQAGASPWIGTWEGPETNSTRAAFGTCGGALGSSGGSGVGGGPLTVVVSGVGNELTFLMQQGEGSAQTPCALPFAANGDTATLAPGSACVTSGFGLLETFTAGSATLQGGTMTLQTSEVAVQPAAPSAEPGPPQPQGLDQVNVGSLSATLHRVADGG